MIHTPGKITANDVKTGKKENKRVRPLCAAFESVLQNVLHFRVTSV